MAPTTSQSLLIPSCQLGRILVKVWTRKINPSTWERTAPGPWMDANILDPTFAGTIVFMEREIEHMDLTVGDPVAGLVSGGEWVEAFDSSNQRYLSVPLESVWRISDADAKKLGIIIPVTCDDCTII